MVVILGSLFLETSLRRYAYVWISSKGFNVSSFFFYVTFPFLHCLILFMHVIPSSCVFMQLHFLYYSYFFIWLLAIVSLCLYTTLFGCLKLPVYLSLSLWQYCNDIDLWSIPPCYMKILLLKWVRSRYKNLQSCKHKLQNKQKSMQSSTTKIHTYAHKHTHIHMYAHCMKGKVSMNSPKKFLALSTICSRK